MIPTKTPSDQEPRFIAPACPVFGECGGCQHQDMPYEDELRLKEEVLKQVMEEQLSVDPCVIEPIVRSPQEYHYRSRLDLKLLKTKEGKVIIGFTPVSQYQVVEVDACPIALKAISDFIPQLKKEARASLPARYRLASLVVKAGDDGRVFWGGIGKRSLRMQEKDYFWAMVKGKKIYYSLESFFQANLSILDCLMDQIEALGVLDPQTTLYDLYGGVGLFTVSLYDKVKKVVLVEENKHAITCAKYNLEQNGIGNAELVTERTEDYLKEENEHWRDAVIIVDPPRQGLHQDACRILAGKKSLRALLYLSCSPDALIRDVGIFLKEGWRVEKILPFDFFPRTKHLENLIVLRPPQIS